jgi:flagellar hook-associated protein 1 FlgK
VSQFQGYQAQFNQLNTQVNGQIQAEASTVTSLAQSIANVNGQIQTATANSSGQPPNNLLDQRANLIDQLSQHVNVSTVTQTDGTVSVFVGSGQALVIGNQASTLSATADPLGSGQLDLSVQAGTGGNVDITSALSGGTIGGLLQFRTQMLDPGEGSVGQAAVTLTNLLNTQNAAGLDQNGTIGAALLAVGGPQVLASSNNTGTASISASISNLGGLTGSNYDLTYGGTSWSLVNTSSGASTALTATPPGGGPTTLTGGPGITLTVATGTAKAGDEFLVEPTANAVAGLSLLTTDPTKIAAAGPLITSANSANTGSAGITSATVPNTAASAWTPSNYTISFSSPTAYTVTNAAGTAVPAVPATYTPGTAIAFEGIDVSLTGTPAANDSFSVNTNTNGIGDNSNALLLAGIVNQKVLAGGAQSLSDAVNAYVGTVGLQTSQAQNGATAQQAVLNSAQTAQQSVQGVNLDEEAAKMLQYQQAYQAAAQVISTSKTLFDSLINAISTA